MKRTLKEKYEYNHARNTPFSTGYSLGVMVYGDYRQFDDEGKKIVRELIDTNKSLARDGDVMSKGFMCGVRDAANERKSKQKRK